MRLIVGLGNPGAEYEMTRHNLGFMLVDLLARQSNADIKRKDCRALLGRANIAGETLELVKPQTFMNLSGETVSCLRKKNDYVEDASKIIVISDDLALPFGKIRIRSKGSAGGHNGLKSIIAHIKGDEFIRLRIGIQPNHELRDVKDFVLEKFSRYEQKELEKVLEDGADAIRAIISDGIESAMMKHN